DGISQADLVRLADLLARGDPPSGGPGRQQPDRGRQRLSLSMADGAGGPHLRVDLAERRGKGRYSGHDGGKTVRADGSDRSAQDNWSRFADSPCSGIEDAGKILDLPMNYCSRDRSPKLAALLAAALLTVQPALAAGEDQPEGAPREPAVTGLKAGKDCFNNNINVARIACAPAAKFARPHPLRARRAGSECVR